MLVQHSVAAGKMADLRQSFGDARSSGISVVLEADVICRRGCSDETDMRWLAHQRQVESIPN